MMCETAQCPDCGGVMWHSDDMDDPFAGTEDRTPFWQCEDCGYCVDAEIAGSADEA